MTSFAHVHRNPKLKIFPTVRATNTSFEAASTAQTVSLPASIVAGELLMIFMSFSSPPSGASASGWTTTLVSESGGGAAVLHKIASGSEGATVEVTIGLGRAAAHASMAITGGLSAEAAVATATNNPPSLTPSWGSDKTLWLAICTGGIAAGIAQTLPTNYTNILTSDYEYNPGNEIGLDVGRYANQAASEDPGAFGQSWPDVNLAITVGVQP
jgi:hypothetical protein